MQRAPVFYDPHASCGYLFCRPVGKSYHAIGNIFFQAVSCQGFLPLFTGNDRGNAFFLQPVEKAPQFSAKDSLICKTCKQSFYSVQHNSLCLNRIDRMLQTYKESFKVKRPCLLNLAPFNPDIIYSKFFACDKVIYIKTKGREILCKVFRSFFKTHKNTGLIILEFPPEQKLHGKHCLAAARAAADEGGSSLRQSPSCYLIKTLYAGGAFFKTDHCWFSSFILFGHKILLSGSPSFLFSFFYPLFMFFSIYCLL